MKLKGLLLAGLSLLAMSANALIVSVNNYGDIEPEGMTITVTEAEEDLLSGKNQMNLTGTLLTDNPLTVTIRRSEAGLDDEFCCANQCTTGNGLADETLSFQPNGMVNWFCHYTPAMNSDVTVRYTFHDGQDSLTLTVRYIYSAVPASFPKKHLIEEFTGQDCGYCPYGMDCIHDFIGNDTNWVLILHHYGYTADHFSVSGSKTITTALNVSGAPSSAINRANTKTSEGNAVIFHPAYLPSVKKSQFQTETYASVCIDNDYNAETRELTVTVSGAICPGDHPDLFLTVLVKESGMIDYQSDYYNTFEGWEQFRHANAVRLFLSAAEGDSIHMDAGRLYSATYTATLNEAWVPENSSIVAFLTESFKPVVQAEERPVVTGTAGGADILHGGIKAVEVSDYYPEYNATDGPSALTGNVFETMTSAAAYYEDITGATVCTIQSYNLTTQKKIGGTNCVPFSFVYVILNKGTRKLHTGTYPFELTLSPGTVLAGYRDDESVVVDGSMFYMTGLTYLKQGYLQPKAQWLIADGTLTIESDRWYVDGHARNGAEIHFGGSGVITNGGYETEAFEKVDAVTAPKKTMQDGQLRIHRGDRSYTITGQELQ